MRKPYEVQTVSLCKKLNTTFTLLFKMNLIITLNKAFEPVSSTFCYLLNLQYFNFLIFLFFAFILFCYTKKNYQVEKSIEQRNINYNKELEKLKKSHGIYFFVFSRSKIIFNDFSVQITISSFTNQQDVL